MISFHHLFFIIAQILIASKIKLGLGFGHAPSTFPNTYQQRIQKPFQSYETRKKEWTNQSLDYYYRLLRENTSKTSYSNLAQAPEDIEVTEIQSQMEQIARRLYFARKKIKTGAPHHAERIYRKLIDDILFSPEMDEACHHSAFAVSTLLLALLLQRQGNVKATRSVFLNFFRKIDARNEGEELECSCSAKVFQAFALFEMKQGNKMKSLELVTKAVSMDQSLASVLKWKQFRDVYNSLSSSTRYAHVKSQLRDSF